MASVSVRVSSARQQKLFSLPSFPVSHCIPLFGIWPSATMTESQLTLTWHLFVLFFFVYLVSILSKGQPLSDGGHESSCKCWHFGRYGPHPVLRQHSLQGHPVVRICRIHLLVSLWNRGSSCSTSDTKAFFNYLRQTQDDLDSRALEKLSLYKYL